MIFFYPSLFFFTFFVSSFFFLHFSCLFFFFPFWISHNFAIFPFDQNPFLILVVLLISCGLFMFTFESTQFNLKGFTMVLVASFIGGIRWTLTQVLMQKAELGQSENDGYLQQSCYTRLYETFGHTFSFNSIYTHIYNYDNYHNVPFF